MLGRTDARARWVATKDFVGERYKQVAFSPNACPIDPILFRKKLFCYTEGTTQESETIAGKIEIVLIWRSSVMPNEVEREQALEAFRQTLADVLD